MGKVTKFTGSKLLGAELRRLRGGRSLKQIAALSKTPPLSERVAPVAAPTLSQVENGISFPSLETLHSLATMYQTSVQQLLDLVVQDRLAEHHAEPSSPSEASERFDRAHGSGSWHECLAVAAWAERATEGAERIRWRANRALVLRRLGMRQDGLTLLQECLEDSDLPARGAWKIHVALADAFAVAGQPRQSAIHYRAATELAPRTLSDADHRRLWASRAFSLLAVNLDRDEPSEREVREAMGHLRNMARRTLAPEERLLVSVHQAACQALLGNSLVAARDLAELVAQASEEGTDRARIEALAVFGVVRRREGKASEAVRLLEEAASLAAESGDLAQAFECCFEAYRAANEKYPDQAVLLLKRCQRYHPFAAGRTPNVVRFERLRQVEAG